MNFFKMGGQELQQIAASGGRDALGAQAEIDRRTANRSGKTPRQPPPFVVEERRRKEADLTVAAQHPTPHSVSLVRSSLGQKVKALLSLFNEHLVHSAHSTLRRPTSISRFVDAKKYLRLESVKGPEFLVDKVTEEVWRATPAGTKRPGLELRDT